MASGSFPKSPLLLIPLLVLVLVVPSCRKGGQEPPASAVLYSMRHQEKSVGQESNTSDGRGATISLEYPEVTGPHQVRDSLNAAIRAVLLDQPPAGSASDGIDSVIAAFLAEYQEFVSATPEYSTRWYDRRLMHVVTDTLGVFSLALEVDTYQGGAHPNRRVRYVNFDATTGRQMAGFFGNGRNDSLLARAERAFRSVRGMPSGESFQGAGFWFENDMFALPNNALITPTGIRFYYNSYEVAPYVMGPTEFELPFLSLSDILPPTSPLSVFVR